MAIQAGLCYSYKQQILSGIHSATDTYKIALFTNNANLTPNTTVYSSSNEVSGQNYVAGGLELTGFSVSGSSGVARLDFDSVTFSAVTVTARAALIYNSSKGNKSVCVVDFNEDITATNGDFFIDMPPAGNSTSLIRIA
jgi:hypothetical protein